MSESAIVVVGTEAYIPHAQSLMANCVKQGNWAGDFCFLCAQDCDTSKLEGRGIHVFQCEEKSWSNAVKFHLFSPYFRKWERLLYLDCDILIQGDLNEACNELEDRFPLILCDGPQQSTVLDDWIHFAELTGDGPEKHPEVFAELTKRFPHIHQQIHTSDAMCFCPDTIPETTTQELLDVQAEFQAINPRSYDQQVFNLLLYDRMGFMGKDHCTWFPFDEPSNRVVSEPRGWDGTEEPEILHYWSAHAPWIEKTPDAGGYFNYRLDKPSYDVYQENLAAFETVFPRS